MNFEVIKQQYDIDRAEADAHSKAEYEKINTFANEAVKTLEAAQAAYDVAVAAFKGSPEFIASLYRVHLLKETESETCEASVTDQRRDAENAHEELLERLTRYQATLEAAKEARHAKLQDAASRRQAASSHHKSMLQLADMRYRASLEKFLNTYVAKAKEHDAHIAALKKEHDATLKKERAEKDACILALRLENGEKDARVAALRKGRDQKDARIAALEKERKDLQVSRKIVDDYAAATREANIRIAEVQQERDEARRAADDKAAALDRQRKYFTLVLANQTMQLEEVEDLKRENARLREKARQSEINRLLNAKAP